MKVETKLGVKGMWQLGFIHEYFLFLFLRKIEITLKIFGLCFLRNYKLFSKNKIICKIGAIQYIYIYIYINGYYKFKRDINMNKIHVEVSKIPIFKFIYLIIIIIIIIILNIPFSNNSSKFQFLNLIFEISIFK